MASSPLLLVSSRLSVLPRASASSSSAASPPACSSINCSAAAAPVPLRRTSAAAAGYVGGERVVRGYASQFNGASVAVRRGSSAARGSATGNRSGVAASSPRCALVQKVTANELDSILSEERTSPMIIDFYATWCGPCVVLAQELEQLAVEYGEDIRFLKVDTDEEHELASQMEIRGLPTMVFVSKDVDKLAIRTEGLLPTNAIREIIEKEILV